MGGVEDENFEKAMEWLRLYSKLRTSKEAGGDVTAALIAAVDYALSGKVKS